MLSKKIPTPSHAYIYNNINAIKKKGANVSIYTHPQKIPSPSKYFFKNHSLKASHDTHQKALSQHISIIKTTPSKHHLIPIKKLYPNT